MILIKNKIFKQYFELISISQFSFIRDTRLGEDVYFDS